MAKVSIPQDEHYDKGELGAEGFFKLFFLQWRWLKLRDRDETSLNTST